MNIPKWKKSKKSYTEFSGASDIITFVCELHWIRVQNPWHLKSNLICIWNNRFLYTLLVPRVPKKEKLRLVHSKGRESAYGRDYACSVITVLILSVGQKDLVEEISSHLW